MAAVTPVRRQRSAPPRSEAKRAELRVVRANERARAVGAIGSLLGAVILAVLFALAGLHAVLVQTQARLDSIDSEISSLVVERNEALAELAWHDSPDGLAEAASQAGLALATDVEILTPVAVGELAAPGGPDPFGGVAG